MEEIKLQAVREMGVPEMTHHIATGSHMRAVSKRHKYNAMTTHCTQGHFHSSLGESVRCDHLHLLQKAKVITELEVGGSITIAQGFKYKPDFRYVENGVKIVEDFKGVITQRFRDIKRMWPYHGDGVLRVSKLVGKKFHMDKDIQGKPEPKRG